RGPVPTALLGEWGEYGVTKGSRRGRAGGALGALFSRSFRPSTGPAASWEKTLAAAFFPPGRASPSSGRSARYRPEDGPALRGGEALPDRRLAQRGRLRFREWTRRAIGGAGEGEILPDVQVERETERRLRRSRGPVDVPARQRARRGRVDLDHADGPVVEVNE